MLADNVDVTNATGGKDSVVALSKIDTGGQFSGDELANYAHQNGAGRAAPWSGPASDTTARKYAALNLGLAKLQSLCAANGVAVGVSTKTNAKAYEAFCSLVDASPASLLAGEASGPYNGGTPTRLFEIQPGDAPPLPVPDATLTDREAMRQLGRVEDFAGVPQITAERTCLLSGNVGDATTCVPPLFPASCIDAPPPCPVTF